MEDVFPCARRAVFVFSSRRRRTRCSRDWSSDVCSSDLPHFGPTMIHLNCPILINQRKGARLVQMGNSKADAELHRSDCHTSFLMRMGFIPFGNLFSSPGVRAGFFQFPPYALNAIVFDRLAVMSGVCFSFPSIEISFAHHLGRQAKPARDSIQYLFYHKHSLRPSKSTESRSEE